MADLLNCKQFFKDADADGSGSLTLKELTDLLRGRGFKGTDAELEGMFSTCSFDTDGKVSEDEFLTAMGCVSEEVYKAAVLRKVCLEFDLDGSGQIDAAELKNVMASQRSDGQCSQEEADRLLQMCDDDGSGTVDYEELIQHTFGKPAE